MNKCAFAVPLAFPFLVQPGTALRATQMPEWPAPRTLLNGDTNGDAAINVSDSIYLLGHLFLGGPAPVPLGCGKELSLWQNGDANGDWRVDLSDAVYLLASLFLGGPPPISACDNPEILLVDSQPFGLSYGEWSARWWQWALCIPRTSSPLLDENGEDCAVGQSGPVFFLAGAFTATPITRACTVPFGKSIVFPFLT